MTFKELATMTMTDDSGPFALGLFSPQKQTAKCFIHHDQTKNT